MKISGLQIDNYGIWSGLSIDSFPDGVVVFYGPNEAGKSTLLQFLRTMLYGFNDQQSRRFVRHLDGEQAVLSIGRRVGGSLSLVTSEEQYHVQRYASLTEPLDPTGEVRVTARDGSRQGAHRLSTLLAGIDETIFNNVFAVSLREMQHLGTLNDTQAARFLYNLSTGSDRVSLVNVMRQLQETRARLMGGDEEAGYLRGLLEKRSACLDQLQKLSVQGDLWAQRKSELDRLVDEVARLEAAREKCHRRTRDAELALRAQPLWERQEQLKVELETLGQARQVPDDVIDRLTALDQEAAMIQGRYDEQEQQLLQLQRDLQSLSSSSMVTRQLARIEALLDQQSTITGLHDDVQRLKTEADESEFEIHAEQERLGIGADGRSIVRFEAATFSSLREPARNIEHLRSLLEQIKKDSAAAKQEAQQVEQYLAETLGQDRDWLDGKDQQDIVRALEQTGEVAAALRQRSQCEQRVRDCSKQLETLTARRKRLLVCQLLPWEVIKALGALFAVGVMLMIWAYFGDRFGLDDRLRTGLGILGAIGVAVATLLKLVLQSASQEDLDLCNRDTEAMDRKLEQARLQLDQLDRKLPAQGTGPVKLRDAETRIVRLESLLPLEGQRRRILDRVTAAEQQAVEIATQLKAARHLWEQQLETLGLSRRLTPDQVRDLAGESGSLVQLHRRHEEAVYQRERAERELLVYRQRMRDVMADTGIGGPAGTALDELSHLQLHVKQHQQHRSQRDALQEKIRRTTQQQQQTLARLHELDRRRQSVLTTAGAVDDEDLRNLKRQREQFDALRKQCKDVAREIRLVLGSDRESVNVELCQQGLESIQKSLTAGNDELQRIDQRLKELFLRRGQVAEQLNSLCADRQQGQLRIELGMLDAKLDAGVRQWKTISVITTLLKTVYKRYETERQPETLKEASQYLSRMTAGRYLRVWTPLDDDVLIIESQHGESWTVNQLSRGTREQLFLALRLALVSGYARRGIKMPLVLDDVLVNFDQERTQAAAEVLVDFAQAGQQLLVFTCHQHIMALFQTLDAHVQTLPGRDVTGSVLAPAPVTHHDHEVGRNSTPSRKRRKTRNDANTDLGHRQPASAFLIGFSADDGAPLDQRPLYAESDPVSVSAPLAVALAGDDEDRNPWSAPNWSSVDEWEFGQGSQTELAGRDYVEQLFPAAHAMRREPGDQTWLGDPTDADQPFHLDESERGIGVPGVNADSAAIDWYPESSDLAEQSVESRPETLDFAQHRQGSIITDQMSGTDGLRETRFDAAAAPLSATPAGSFAAMDAPRLDELAEALPQLPAAAQSHLTSGPPIDVRDAGNWLPPEASCASISPRILPSRAGQPSGPGLDELEFEPVIDLPLEDEATDLTAADFRDSTKNASTAPCRESDQAAPSPQLRESSPIERIDPRSSCHTTPAAGDTELDDEDAHEDGVVPHRPTVEFPPLQDDGGSASERKADGVESQSIQTESSEVLGSQAVISSTSRENLPIVFRGSVVKSAEQPDPVADEEIKEEPMSTVDPLVSEALPPDTPLEPADTEPAADLEAGDETYEYEYVDADEDADDDYETATATGDVEDGVEYEYEYVDEDEEEADADDDDDDDEYEYVEVEVDEDGNEIVATAVKDGEAVDEYEYEDEDEDEDGCEVATATGDVEDEVEYEYEYVDDEEADEDEDDS